MHVQRWRQPERAILRDRVRSSPTDQSPLNGDRLLGTFVKPRCGVSGARLMNSRGNGLRRLSERDEAESRAHATLGVHCCRQGLAWFWGLVTVCSDRYQCVAHFASEAGGIRSRRPSIRLSPPGVPDSYAGSGGDRGCIRWASVTPRTYPKKSPRPSRRIPELMGGSAIVRRSSCKCDRRERGAQCQPRGASQSPHADGSGRIDVRAEGVDTPRCKSEAQTISRFEEASRSMIMLLERALQDRINPWHRASLSVRSGIASTWCGHGVTSRMDAGPRSVGLQ